MPWFRFYSEAISDLKLKRVARDSGLPMATVLGVWTILLSIASSSPERGVLLLSKDTPATDDDITDLAGCNVSETLQKLRETGLVTSCNGAMCIPAWASRQFDSDSSTPRVQKSRNLKKTQGKTYENTPNETLHDGFGNVSVTPPETDTETDTDQIVIGVVGASPQNVAAVFKAWQDNMPGTMTPVISDELSDLIDTYGPESCIHAITEASRSNVRNMRYVVGILKNLQNGNGKPTTNGRNGYNGNGRMSNVEKSLAAVNSYFAKKEGEQHE